MNVYIIDEFVSSQKNGIGTFMKELVFSLQSLNFNICILEFNSNEEHFCIKKENNIKKICFPPFSSPVFLLYYKIIDKFFRLYIEDSSKNVFLFNHSPCEKFLEAVKFSFPLSKTVFTIHDMGWAQKLFGDSDQFKEILYKRKQKKIKNKYDYILSFFDEERRMYSLADKIICLSRDTQDLLFETYKVAPKKIHLIPNGIRDTYIYSTKNDIVFLKENMSVSKNEKIILYVGRLTEVKGCFVLLDCFKSILKQYPYCRLVLAGTMQNSQSIFELCRTFSSKVTFTGLIGCEELKKWYQIADIGIIPSYTEQSSYTAIEMMMYGLAIVSANGYGLRNMFENEENALTVDIKRDKDRKEYVENLSNTILRLLKDKNLCNKLSIGSRTVFLNRFEKNHMQENYKKLFDSLER